MYKYTIIIKNNVDGNINNFLLGIQEKPGAANGLVGPKAYVIYGALFKKKNTKLRIQN